MRRWALPVCRSGLVALLAAGLAACGTASSTRTTSRSRGSAPPSGQLAISPAQGNPATVFRASFSPPPGSQSADGVRTGFNLGLSGPAGQNCAVTASVRLDADAGGATTSANLNPSVLGGRWCPGRYAARVTEVQTPICSPGTMCPQFVRVVGIVARGGFTVNPR